MSTEVLTDERDQVASRLAAAQRAVSTPRYVDPRRRQRRAARILLYAIFLVLGIGMVFPFVWMVASSLKHAKDLYTLSLFTSDPAWGNYRTVVNSVPFGRWFVNSLVVAGITTAGVAFFDSLAGYTLAKFQFPGRQVIFIVILSTLMVPTEMLVIPWYLMTLKLSFSDSYLGLLMPGIMSAFGVFLMRQFFAGVPNDLLDAARLDGVSEFRIFWNIALPLVKPALAALCIFTFLGNWNAYIWPLIVTNSPTMMTLPVGMGFFSQGEAGSKFELIMTAATLATVPVLIVFVIFQRQIIKGIALTGIKG